MQWQGVFPAITTPFDEGYAVDHAALRAHARWMIDEGCEGVIPLGSLGEASTLAFDEKVAILTTCVAAVDRPVVASVSASSTAEGIALARAAEKAGCAALMVLPPYVYRGDDREIETYFGAVIGATRLPCMLYNNPIAYGTDVVPGGVARLAARHANLTAIKESSTDVRRVTEIRRLLGDRLAILVGVDDAIVEGMEAGAVGWVAGLVNAFPRESVELHACVRDGKTAEARALYEWFLPLLRLDTVPKFVQLIKFVQAERGRGDARVRPPRLELDDAERSAVRELLAVAR